MLIRQHSTECCLRRLKHVSTDHLLLGCSLLEMILLSKIKKRKGENPLGCPLQGSPQQIICLQLTSVPLHHLLSHQAALFPPSLPPINLLLVSPYRPPACGSRLPHTAWNTCEPSPSDLRDFISEAACTSPVRRPAFSSGSLHSTLVGSSRYTQHTFLRQNPPPVTSRFHSGSFRVS